MTRSRLTLFFLMVWTISFAQDAEMADVMRSDGKIYVVIGVLAVIFLCLLFFLVYLERKISRLEKRLREREQGRGTL